MSYGIQDLLQEVDLHDCKWCWRREGLKEGWEIRGVSIQSEAKHIQSPRGDHQEAANREAAVFCGSSAGHLVMGQKSGRRMKGRAQETE